MATNGNKEDVSPLLTSTDNNTQQHKKACTWKIIITILVVSLFIIATISTILALVLSDSTSSTKTTESIPTVLLSNAASPSSYMPVIGLGTGGYWTAKNANTTPDYWNVTAGYKNALKWFSLFEHGIIRFDCANSYDSNPGVAQAIHNYTHNFRTVSRDKVFITSKTGLEHPMGYNETFHELDIILNMFQIDYVDLLLVHWPHRSLASTDIYCNNSNINYSPSKCRKSTWKAFEKIFETGKAKAIGVSNFMIKHLNDTFYFNDGIDFDDEGLNINYLPAVNQFEFHGYWHKHELVQYCQDRNILVNGYASLGTPDVTLGYWNPLLIHHPVALRVAEKYSKSAAQVWLKWAYQQNIVLNPRSSNIDHQLENIDIFDFELTQQEMLQLTSIDPPPNTNPYIGTNPEDLP
eukprot:359818_1